MPDGADGRTETPHPTDLREKRCGSAPSSPRPHLVTAPRPVQPISQLRVRIALVLARLTWRKNSRLWNVQASQETVKQGLPREMAVLLGGGGCLAGGWSAMGVGMGPSSRCPGCFRPEPGQLHPLLHEVRDSSGYCTGPVRVADVTYNTREDSGVAP